MLFLGVSQIARLDCFCAAMMIRVILDLREMLCKSARKIFNSVYYGYIHQPGSCSDKRLPGMLPRLITKAVMVMGPI